MESRGANHGTLWTPEPSTDRRILGLDEAGRGSVLGPLVVGGFLISESRMDQFARLEVRDSKKLSPRRREELYRKLRTLGTCVALPIPPRTIDRWVSHNQLNDLEAQAFGRLIRQTRPDATFADACHPIAHRFGSRVAIWARSATPIFARHHADRDIQVVSAASIVAKVVRDRAMHRLARRLGLELGTGYPSDPRTLAHLRSALALGTQIPEWIRRSWSTTERLKPRIAASRLEAFDQ